MTYDIFTDENDKQTAREVMPQLVDHPAWKFIVRSIEANIKYLTNELTDGDFKTLLEVQLKQEQIAHLTSLLYLPQTILQAAAPEIADEEEAIYE